MSDLTPTEKSNTETPDGSGASISVRPTTGMAIAPSVPPNTSRIYNFNNLESKADSEPVRPNSRDSVNRLGKSVRIITRIVFASVLFISALIVSYRWIDPPTSTLILGQRLAGSPITQYWRQLEDISPNLIAAVVMSEDAAFCQHRGVDWAELEAAYERGQSSGSAGGGSTISMQVTKNLFLWPSRSYLRKALEIPLTLAAEVVWPKRRILELYLNIAELGPGIFGAEAAAQHYFKKTARSLTTAEAALLATALPSPRTRDSASPSQLHRRLAARIEARMRGATRQTGCIFKS